MTGKMKECEGCIYVCQLAASVWCCDYLGLTGHRRQCPPGADCTVRVQGKKERRPALKI